MINNWILSGFDLISCVGSFVLVTGIIAGHIGFKCGKSSIKEK